MQSIKKLVDKALNKNQNLILFSVANEEKETMYSLVNRLNEKEDVSVSTLKMNAMILRNLGLITYNGTVSLTSSGNEVKNILGGEFYGK